MSEITPESHLLAVTRYTALVRWESTKYTGVSRWCLKVGITLHYIEII